MPSAKQIVGGAALGILLAIGFVVLLIILAEGYANLFPTADNPFATIYNTIRSLALFIVSFASTWTLLVGSMFIDAAFDISGTLANAIFGLPNWGDSINLLAQAQILVDQLIAITETFFPPLSISA